MNKVEKVLSVLQKDPTAPYKELVKIVNDVGTVCFVKRMCSDPEINRIVKEAKQADMSVKEIIDKFKVSKSGAARIRSMILNLETIPDVLDGVKVYPTKSSISTKRRLYQSIAEIDKSKVSFETLKEIFGSLGKDPIDPKELEVVERMDVYEIRQRQ